jgi:outer membrane protein TolC
MRKKGIKIGSLVLVLLFVFSVQGLATTLNESVNLALRNNPSVQSAQSKVEAAGAKVAQSVSAFLPTVRLDATTSKNYTQPSVMQFDTGGGITNIVVGTSEIIPTKSIALSLSQPLFAGGKILTGYGSASKNWEIANQNFRKTKQEVIFNTISAYLGVLKAQEYVKLANESVDLTSRQVKRIEAMLNNGMVTKAELLRSQVQQANAQVAQLRANNGLEIAKNIYNNVVGSEIDSPVELTEQNFDINLPAQTDEKSLQVLAFSARPDWKQFQASKGLADDAVKMAYSTYLPNVALVGQTSDRIQEYSSFKSDVSSWNWGITGTWSIDNFAPPMRVREASSNLEAMKSDEENIHRQVILEVRNSIFELKSAKESLPGAKKAVALAEETYQAAVVRFEAGATTNLEMMDAMIALTDAKFRWTQALYDYEIAKAKINKVCGQDLL